MISVFGGIKVLNDWAIALSFGDTCPKSLPTNKTDVPTALNDFSMDSLYNDCVDVTGTVVALPEPLKIAIVIMPEP
jgi:hypothetical protein